MVENLSPKTIAVIAGPTASGKSSLALALAKVYPSVIINADASQVYADLRIVSARPNDEDMANVPHCLFGHIDGARPYSAAQWAREAQVEIEGAFAKGRLPIIVGGTGLYLRTLIEGIAPIPDIDGDIRRQVRALPVEDAWACLQLEDRQVAERLNASDATRIARALEVVRSTGQSILYWRDQKQGGLDPDIKQVGIVMLPPRTWLNERCDARFVSMLEDGGANEVKDLMARQLDPALPVMRAIGVSEIAAMLSGAITKSQAIALGQLATRQYAKRQYTWFRNQPPTGWLRSEAQLNDENLNKLVIKLR